VALPAVSVLEYHLTGYRHTWHSTAISSLAIPVLLLLGLGVAVGTYVDRAGALGQPYLRFVAPGMLATTGLQVAVLESSFPVLTAFRFQKTYLVMAAAPLRVADMILGRLGYVALRVALAVTAFLVVMLPFGAVRSPWAVLAPPVAVLLGLAAAAPMFAYAASVRTPNLMVTLIRLVMLPTTLASGVFFPVDRLPALLRTLAYALPLWHGVELSRAATLGVAPAWPVPAHLAVLALWLAAGFALASIRFTKRLAV
jgi:lipooligosaccharide transport system permease protein